MQDNQNKSKFLIDILGRTVKQARICNTTLSCNKAEEEYDIARGNLNRLENGKTDPTFTTLWKASEATGQKLSSIISLVEDMVGDDFSLTD